MKLVCYTIGHSIHSAEKFISLLQTHHISCVVDVRSVPYSQRMPHFNREFIKGDLADHGIKYMYMGDALGARHDDPQVFLEDKNVPDFEKVRQTQGFQKGLHKLLALIRKGEPVALMCSEKDPFQCHRFALVTRALADTHVEVRHILEDASLTSSRALEDRLLSVYNIDYQQVELFSEGMSREEAVAEGYRLRNRDIGYESK